MKKFWRVLMVWMMTIMTSNSIAQIAAPLPVTGGGTGRNVYDHQLLLQSKKGLGLIDESIEGSPYLEKEFRTGSIRTKDGVFNNVPLRFNVADDVIEYQDRGVTYVAEPSLKITYVKFPAYDLVVDKLPARGKLLSFFVRLDSGKAVLLERKVVQFKAAEAPKALESSGKAARYQEYDSEFYIRIDDALPQLVGNVKKTIAMLPDHREELETFAKTNRISKGGADLTKLIRYYNSLQQ